MLMLILLYFYFLVIWVYCVMLVGLLLFSCNVRGCFIGLKFNKYFWFLWISALVVIILV